MSSLVGTTLYNNARIVDWPDYDNIRIVDNGILPLVAEMHKNGMKLDVAHLATISEKCQSEMTRLNDEGNQMTGYPISFASADQVAGLLFQKLAIKTKHKIKLTDSGKREEVDGDTLEMIRDAHPVIPLILEYRQMHKLDSTYCTPLPRKVRRDTGTIHTRLSVTRTGTGRLASSDPNLQNIPTRSKMGQEIRRAFIPRLPGNVYGGIDLSQIELRVVASERNVKKMLEVYRVNGDIHSMTAKSVFQLQDKDPQWFIDNAAKFKKEMRLPCKTINFLVVYEGSAPSLRIQLGAAGGVDMDYWTEKRCEQAITAWYEAYPEVLEGLKLVNQRVKAHRLIWDSLGRSRQCPEITSKNGYVVSQGLRQAGNMPIQSLAAGILKLAMAEIHDKGAESSFGRIGFRRAGVLPLLQIHDELLWEGPKAVIEDFMPMCKEVMIKSYPLISTMDAEYALSEESWGAIPK